MNNSSARTVESEVTSRLESMLTRVSGVKHVKSTSWNGGGNIVLELDRNSDIDHARFEAAMIVRQAWSSMPENTNYPQIAVRQVDDKASRPFMSYTINAGVRPSEIMRYADDNIKPQLSRIPGIAKVELSGATPLEWRIEYDPQQLVTLNLTPSDLQNAIIKHIGSQYLGLALPAPTDSCNWIRLMIANPDATTGLDLSTITVTRHNDQIITLDKIAKLEHDEAAPTSYFRINGLNSIYLNITSTDDANQIELSAKVKECLADMNLPEGYMLNLSYDASESIGRELSTIYFRTALTVLILLVFVGLITLSWRYLTLITISLAINMAVAFLAYYILKVEIQLYSLAGITISLNLVIDNLIVMTEHITRRHNLRAFSAVLAATLTTIGALSVVFFLDEKTMLSLKDFVIVVIVNLSISLLVALLLVPALVERMKLRLKVTKKRKLRRVPIYIMRIYSKTVSFLCRHKGWVYTAFILGFGLPVFLLPEKIKGEGKFAEYYNATIGSPTYKDKIKPWVDKCLGGSLRLFAEKVYNGGYFSRGEYEPVVYINANLPNGSTLGQMNALMGKMEAFLTTQEGVRQFQTSIYGPRRGSIAVYFTQEAQQTSLPYRLKSEAIAKALTLGGGSWGVWGLEDQSFSNDVRESAGNYQIKMRGYNYDELWKHAEVLRDTLLAHKRIREVILNSEFSYWKDDYTEFYLEIDKTKLAKDSLSVADLFNAIKREIGRKQSAGSLSTPNGSEQIWLHSDQTNRDVWGFMNIPIQIGKKHVKISDYAAIERRQTPPDVVKEDQEYILCLQYEYIGSSTQGQRVQERILEQFTPQLPMGYHAEKEQWSWNFGKDAKPYLLLGLIAIIIFFISAILFDSLRQPIAIIFVIPVSFIGVFLTFYVFDLKFDQGGFAAFILLCGITVNAAIYIINEYNSLRRNYPKVSQAKIYMKSFRIKITAVLLTVLSTVLGFIPFVIGETKEGFWFPLAAGTMGGLIMSLAAIFFMLPLLILPRTEKKIRPKKRRKKKLGGKVKAEPSASLAEQNVDWMVGEGGETRSEK